MLCAEAKDSEERLFIPSQSPAVTAPPEGEPKHGVGLRHFGARPQKGPMRPALPVGHADVRDIGPCEALRATEPADETSRSRAVSPGAVFRTGTARFLSTENGGYIDLADAAT